MYSFLSICIFALMQVQGLWARDARDGEAPYQAGVVQTLRNGEYLYICAGAILNQRWIVTLALCVELYPTSSLRVLVGSNILNSPNNVYYNVDDIQYYQNPTNVTFISRNNIALVRISTRFTFNARIQPIRISNQDLKQERETLTTTAWRNQYDPNYVNRLQVLISVGVQDNDDCKSLNARNVNGVRELFCLRESSKDIGNDNLPPFSYQGGPIVGASKQLKGILIVSLNSKPDGTIVGIGLRASLYRQWIYETINLGQTTCVEG